MNPVLNDVIEVGVANYIYQRTELMRSRLQKHFPEMWKHIYTVAVKDVVYADRCVADDGGECGVGEDDGVKLSFAMPVTERIS